MLVLFKLCDIPGSGNLVLFLLAMRKLHWEIFWSDKETNLPWSRNLLQLPVRALIIIFYCRNMEIQFEFWKWISMKRFMWSQYADNTHCSHTAHQSRSRSHERIQCHPLRSRDSSALRCHGDEASRTRWSRGSSPAPRHWGCPECHGSEYQRISDLLCNAAADCPDLGFSWRKVWRITTTTSSTKGGQGGMSCSYKGTSY